MMNDDECSDGWSRECICINIVVVWELCSGEIGMLTTKKSLHFSSAESKLC